MNERTDNLVAAMGSLKNKSKNENKNTVQFDVVKTRERKADSAWTPRGRQVQVGIYRGGQATSSFSLSRTLTPNAPCFTSTSGR